MKKYNIFEQEEPTDEQVPEDPGDPGTDEYPPEEGESNTYKLGRVYELKKIYSRLLALDNYLVSVIDINLISLKKHIKQGIDLFEMLLLNVKEFEQDIDEIIITFYEFIKEIYEFLGKYYKNDKTTNKIKNKSENYISNLQEIEPITIGLTAFSIANIIFKNYVLYKNSKYKQANITCSNYSGKNKDLCKQKFYIKTLKTSINMLKSSMSKCNKSDKPDICKKKIQMNIDNIKKQIDSKKLKIKNLT